jgi:hypothetical protein
MGQCKAQQTKERTLSDTRTDSCQVGAGWRCCQAGCDLTGRHTNNGVAEDPPLQGRLTGGVTCCAPPYRAGCRGCRPLPWQLTRMCIAITRQERCWAEAEPVQQQVCCSTNHHMVHPVMCRYARYRHLTRHYAMVNQDQCASTCKPTVWHSIPAQHDMRSDSRLLCAPSPQLDCAVLLHWQTVAVLMCACCPLIATTPVRCGGKQESHSAQLAKASIHMLLSSPHFSCQPLAAVAVFLCKLSTQSSLDGYKDRISLNGDLSLSELARTSRPNGSWWTSGAM